MRRLHGRDWYEAAGAPRGRIARHLVITSAMAGVLVAALSRRRTASALAVLVAATGVGEFAADRIRRGPIDAGEVGEMLLTSILIPPAAVAHRLRGEWRHRHVGPWRRLPDAVLFDRDGTLVEDVPYNDDPSLVTPVAGAREALSRLRSVGVPVGLITNQSGVASGRITPDRLVAVNARVSGLLGPFGTVQVCVHHRDERCGCRKPEPGLVLAACAELRALPARTVVIGDIGSDMGAAVNAGARGILVPTAATREEELSHHPTAPDLGTAVDRVLAGAW
jgi:histidinol-phosphate phosphatase family protein